MIRTLSFLLLFYFFEGSSEQHFRFDGHPISIHLRPHAEVLVRFKERVEVKLPGGLGQHLQVVNNQGTLLLEAKREFSRTLIEVRPLKMDQAVVLLAISSDQEGNAEDMLITLDSENLPAFKENSQEVEHLAQHILDHLQNSLLSLDASLHRVAMHTSTRLPLYPDQSLQCMPLGMWVTPSSLYFILVMLRNISDEIMHFDPLLLSGSWRFVFLERGKTDPASLNPHFSSQDTLYVVLVSERPLNEVFP